MTREIKYLKFKGFTKMLDDNKEVEGYGCYTDENSRQFILIDDELGTMRPVQVQEIKLTK